MEENREIVFTYRQSQQVEEVVLRCERELPERMRQGPDIPAFVEERQERRESLPEPWRRAIAPAEEPKKGRWGVRLFVGLSLLVGLVCLGVGIWYVGLYGWALPGETPEPSYGQTEPPRARRSPSPGTPPAVRPGCPWRARQGGAPSPPGTSTPG